ncbi:hypothetical protein [Flavobacterium petrolei]|uniref:hypothetical protein n=1 Tax=Flavobacterium petrolei TaxID=2259594 RepID=UPI0037577373
MKKIFIFLTTTILFISCSKEKKDSNNDAYNMMQFEHMKKSIEYNNKAIELINSDTSLTITQNQMNEHIELLKKAVNEAKKVDTLVLNDIKNKFGNFYEKKYIQGIEQQIKGYETDNPTLAIKGQILYDEYIDWKAKEGL